MAAAAIIFIVGLAGCERKSTETAAPETSANETQASFDALVSVTNTHIREGNFDAAETSLREMEQLGNLTEPMRQQIQTMRAALNAARTGGTGATPSTPPPTPAATE
ncbi:MAG TPA: hypothetical protein VGR35_07630 [Tepidisphaeraceae bacterium]|nr:hypothetical protein [Tepidisphaeraceae bacterium]